MFDNPFLIDLKISLNFEKVFIDELSEKIERCILDNDYKLLKEYSDSLSYHVDRFHEIRKMIEKEKDFS